VLQSAQVYLPRPLLTLAILGGARRREASLSAKAEVK
jgi:hypothetical protein